MFKDTNCGELRKEHAGREVRLAGWVNRRRDHGSLIFIDLRDRSGIAQVVFNPQTAPQAAKMAENLRGEWVVGVRGNVVERPAGTENSKIPSGDIEVQAVELEVFNESKPPPFYVNDDSEVDEALRLRYRPIYLRRQRIQNNLVLRHKIIQQMRRYLDTRGFLEIETPILGKSTPEGARDYLVPSRLYPGSFYALPQSPQQMKQLLMVSGYEKYYQIARCFRDEDLRADRQPEFTQLDLEMSFVEQEDILALMEPLYTSIVEEVTPSKHVTKPFPRLTYKEAMEKYGSDKPDLRFGLELTDLEPAVRGTQFQVFRQALTEKGVVKGITAPGCAGYSRKQLDDLTQMAKDKGARGLITIALEPGASTVDSLSMEHVRSVAARYFTIDEVKGMAHAVGAKPSDLLLIVAGAHQMVNTVLGALRLEIGKRLHLQDKDHMKFAFVTDFPLLEWNAEEKRWNSAHHPFTMPHPEDIQYLESDPARVRAWSYDLVCNGIEMFSGSIRIHRRELQERIFQVLGYTPDETKEKFGHLLEAFEYGAPPHGGIGAGIDRLAMIMADEDNLREVIAFPKTQSATDLLFGAPAPVGQQQLQQVHIKVSPPEQK
ncbi:MAG: aspartate--tRNA ligase [Dehalococcoidia bacterium]|nr:aspartate--tRNA ligase [Dehalococcoidia bacterium]